MYTYPIVLFKCLFLVFSMLPALVRADDIHAADKLSNEKHIIDRTDSYVFYKNNDSDLGLYSRDLGKSVWSTQIEGLGFPGEGSMKIVAINEYDIIVLFINIGDFGKNLEHYQTQLFFIKINKSGASETLFTKKVGETSIATAPSTEGFKLTAVNYSPNSDQAHPAYYTDFEIYYSFDENENVGGFCVISNKFVASTTKDERRLFQEPVSKSRYFRVSLDKNKFTFSEVEGNIGNKGDLLLRFGANRY